AGAVCRLWEEPPTQHVICLHWRRTRFHRRRAGACTPLDAALGPGMAVARCQRSAAASLPLLTVHGCPAWHPCTCSSRSAAALRLLVAGATMWLVDATSAM